MRNKMVMGNWKMNGSLAANESLLSGLLSKVSHHSTTEIAVFPPYPYLAAAHQLLNDSTVGLGAQNVSAHENGAHTGEVSVSMLQELGCGYVIVGHSERRQLIGESSADVAQKFMRVCAAGLVPVLCIGETQEQREQDQTYDVVTEQLDAVLSICQEDQMANAIIAYEPVWAIGTGLAATPAQAQQVHAFLRQSLRDWCEKVANDCRIVYGGSVNSANASSLFELEDVDGALVGGASLSADDFSQICMAAEAK